MTNIIQQLSELYEVPPDHIKTHNEIFYPFHKDGVDLVARVLSAPDLKQHRVEALWVNFVAERGGPTVPIVPAPSGALVETLDVNGTKRFVVAFERAPGAPPTPEEWNPRLIGKLGTAIGKLHVLTRQFHQQHPECRRLDWHDCDIYDWDTWLPKEHEAIRSRCAALEAEIRSLPIGAETYGLIHGDIHQWNMHLHGDMLHFFDTDECECNYLVHDLAVAIYFGVEASFHGASVNAYAERFVGELLEGYACHQMLEPEWIERLPLFIKWRQVMSLVDAHLEWDMDRISDDERILLNRYRSSIENDLPVVHVDFTRFS